MLLQLVDLEYNASHLDEKAVLKHLDRAISSTTLALEHRVAFSQRRLEFLEDFGSTVQRFVRILLSSRLAFLKLSFLSP